MKTAIAADEPEPDRQLETHTATPTLHITQHGRWSWHAIVIIDINALIPGAVAFTRARAVAKAIRQYDRWKARTPQRVAETIPLDAAREERR